MKKVVLTLWFSLFSTLIFSHLSAQSWSGLGSGLNGTCLSLSEFNGELFAGGNFTGAGGNTSHSIAKWNGAQWFSMGQDISSSGSVEAMIQYKNELYIGGSFSVPSLGIEDLMRWNGVNWDTVGFVDHDHIYCFTIYNNELIIGGDGTLKKWDGNSMETIGDIGSWANSVLAMEVHKGKLYVGGNFEDGIDGDTSIKYIASWDGNTWAGLGSGIEGGTWTEVKALEVYEDVLFIGGTFNMAGGANATNIARWDGSNWLSAGTGSQGDVYAFAVYNNSLYSTDEQVLINWNGSDWTPVSGSLDDGISDLLVLDSCMYVAGSFNYADGQSANHIAKYCGSTSNELIERQNTFHLEIYPNPASFEATIRWTIANSELIVFKMLNCVGQEVREFYLLGDGEVIVAKRDLQSGIYFIHAYSKEETLITKKLVIE